MPVAQFRLYFNNTALSEQQLQRFSEIKVDQGIGMAAEAELQMAIGVDSEGRWSGMEEEFTQPFSRLRVEVQIRDGCLVPLIDGPIVGQRFDLSGAPRASKLTLVVQDDSVLLNQDEEAELYENRSPDEIAQELFARFGLQADTDAVAEPAAGLDRYYVRRGTPMQFLRELARQHGMFVYVEAGLLPGSSKGIFKRPDLAAADYPELLLLGAKRNLNQFSAQFDGLRPSRARVEQIRAIDLSPLSASAERSSLTSQGDVAVHDSVPAGQTLLARTREEASDLAAAASAAVDHSSWAYSASGEVRADVYSGVLQPYRTVSLAGAGGHLSGSWLISRVTHTLNDSSYRQSFSLCRNARSAGTAAGGGLLGGVF